MIIFCQAPYHTQFVIDIIDSHKEASIDLFIINVENIYKHFLSLNLSLNSVHYINYDNLFSPKNINSWIKERKRLRHLRKTYFDNYKNEEVFYFSNCSDNITAYFIKSLSKCNNIHFYNVEILETKGKVGRAKTPKNLFKGLMYWLITGIKFKWLHVTGFAYFLFFPYTKFGIKQKEYLRKVEIKEKYLYTPIVKENDKVILLLESNLNSYDYYKNYEEELSVIINHLKKVGFKIFLKSHPRLGATPFVKELVDEEIPIYIPSEFININAFSKIVGIGSIGLTELAKKGTIPVYSLINLLSSSTERIKNTQIYQLSQYSKGTISFPSEIKEIIH